jgi:hypothetical protein
MREKLEEILHLLRKEYNQRQSLIADNTREIQDIPVDINTIDTKMELDEINRELRRRNDGNIELQNAINKYLKENAKYPTESSRSMSVEEAFQLTLTGDLDYNPRHPFFFDYGFYMKLMEYLIEKEDYTMCHLIKRRRDEVFGTS